MANIEHDRVKIGIKEQDFKKDHVIKLNQSLYGRCQSPRNFFLYLKGNLEKTGFHQSKMNPCLFISAVTVGCYVDTDFAIIWIAEDDPYPDCVKSRTRYDICINGSPIVWSSKLQSLITNSTMEAEYVAMSTVCCEVIPFCDFINKVAKADIFTKGLGPTLYDVLRRRLYSGNVSMHH